MIGTSSSFGTWPGTLGIGRGFDVEEVEKKKQLVAGVALAKNGR